MAKLGLEAKIPTPQSELMMGDPLCSPCCRRTQLRNTGDTRVASIGRQVKARRCRELLPSPFREGLGVGVEPVLHCCAPRHDPPPQPSPARGRESQVAQPCLT